MKVTAVDTCVLTVPTPKPMALQYPQHKLVVAQIATDEGIRGLGYSLVFGGGGAEAVHAYVERLKPALIGEDPTYVEYLWEKMFRVDMGMKKQGAAAYALSALDIGLWDVDRQSARQAALQAVGRGAPSHPVLRQRRLGEVHASTTWCAKPRSTRRRAAATTR